MRDKRNYIIISLCLITLIMTVGFAAFSTSLQINGTANISTNWCVGFDNRNTSAYQITKGKSTGTNPTGSMSFSGTACSSYYVPNSTLSASFYQPGDKIEYTLTIANKSSMTAAIESIEVNGNDVTSNQTITDGNIIWKVYMPESTTLASNATTTMVVSAEFQNTTDISNLTTGGSSSLTVAINTVQDDGNGGFTPTASTFSGTIYRNNNVVASIGDSIGEVGEYTTNASTLNKTYYLKHTVVNDIITASYVCFVTDTEHCMQGGDSSYYNANKTLLQGQETWFNNHSGVCSFGDSNSECSGGGLPRVGARSDGSVGAGVPGSGTCVVNPGGVEMLCF